MSLAIDKLPTKEMTKSPLSGVGETWQKLAAVRLLRYCSHIFSPKRYSTFLLILGLLFGITIFEIINNVITPLNTIQESFDLTNDLIFIIGIVFITGIAAALFPAIKASQISVANQLSRNI